MFLILFFLFINKLNYLIATTESPTSFPTYVPSVSPTTSPTVSPTLLPTVFLQPKPLGYYYSSTYYGITCDSVDSNPDAIIQISGNSFGNCLVAYNESGYAVSSASYVSSCELVNDEFVAYYTTYSDTACQKPNSLPEVVYYPSGCTTSGDETTKYYCVSSSTSAPYQTVSGGYILGYTSTIKDCQNALPHTYLWTKSGICLPYYTASTNLFQSSKFTCNSDSIRTTENYYDSTCSNTITTSSTRVSLCQFDYTNSDEFSNYIYADCQGNQKSSNDDISMSSEDYAGAVAGTLFAGIILGVVLGAVILIFCCKYSK